MPFIQQGEGGGAQPHSHTCRPPRHWPWLSRRRHPTGSVWECDQWVPWGQGVVQRGTTQQLCGRRWRLTWFAHPPVDQPLHRTRWAWGGRIWDATWTQVTPTPKRPGTPPAGRGA